MSIQTKTISVRVKDKHAPILRKMAFDVNQVWNAANAETANFGWTPIPFAGEVYIPAPSAFDLQKKLKGIRRDRNMSIGSTTFQETIAEHAKKRKQSKREKLNWRKSGGSRRSLGWVPFKRGAAKWVDGKVVFAKHSFKVWDSYGLGDFEFRAGSFSEDARGRWYFNVAVQVPTTKTESTSGVGIDLGLKTTAVCSDGEQLESGKFYRDLEEKLGTQQRAGNKKQVRNIHAKIKNRRKDAIQKFTTKIIEAHGFIAVGNVSSTSLSKTKMAKSVLDAGWSMLKTQLKYKAIARSAVFVEVNEAYSTQACSSCGSIPDSSPKGMDGLEVREWTCSCCGAQHDRDINAAKNILALGSGGPVDGIPAL